MAEVSSCGRQDGQNGERDFRADALHVLQQAEPVALGIAQKAEQPDGVLAHLGLDGQNGGLAGARQSLQGAGGAGHDIADAMHVEDHMILVQGIHHALEFADHLSARDESRAAKSNSVGRTKEEFTCPPAAAARFLRAAMLGVADRHRQGVGRVGGSRPRLRGSSIFTIMAICAFSAWPAPTTVFFTRLAAYSVTSSPASAGTTRAMPRA